MNHLTEVSSLAANTKNPGELPRIRREISEGQIAILTFDHPDKSANIFDTTTMREFNAQLAEIETLDVRGLVIRSAKPTIFIAGADIGALGSLPKAALNTFIHKGQTVFQRLADLEIPTVAAIHGACMGGGLELALACDWRVASDARSTKLGLPETQLGILPAWGGSTRLPRLIGLPKALGLILTGKSFNAKKGHKLGIIDAVVPREQLVKHASVLVEAGKRPAAAHVKTNNPVSAGATKIFAGLKVRKQTRGHYPAQLEALKVATAAVSTSVEKSLENEREAVLKLAETDACKNLIRVFNMQQSARRLGANGKKVERAAVIGAGVMGAGIAHWVSSRGMPVLMQDIDEAKVA
ncbi:MAG: enoyl-CoA hydratase-related protein, partial [Verrucomicrobiota bacterium]